MLNTSEKLYISRPVVRKNASGQPIPSRKALSPSSSNCRCLFVWVESCKWIFEFSGKNEEISARAANRASRPNVALEPVTWFARFEYFPGISQLIRAIRYRRGTCLPGVIRFLDGGGGGGSTLREWPEVLIQSCFAILMYSVSIIGSSFSVANYEAKLTEVSLQSRRVKISDNFSFPDGSSHE